MAVRELYTAPHQSVADMRHADLIVVRDRGAIVEQSTQDELIAKQGF
jgi:ABC-type multidrug transport system fused ATPase/permease subunit